MNSDIARPMTAAACQALSELSDPEVIGDEQRITRALTALLPEASVVWCRLSGREASAGAARADHEALRERAADGEIEARVSPGDVPSVRPRLALAARMLALAARANASDPRVVELLTLAEAAGSVIHDANNNLQAMVMQAAVLGLQAPPHLQHRIGIIREEGKKAGVKLQLLQTIQPWHEEENEKSDLVAAVRRVLRESPGLAEATLPEGEVFVSASPAGLSRLVLLISRIARSLTRGPSAKLRVSSEDGGLLEADLPGVEVTTDDRGRRLLPPCEGPVAELERHAAYWLVRQDGGRLEPIPRPGGAVYRAWWSASD